MKALHPPRVARRPAGDNALTYSRSLRLVVCASVCALQACSGSDASGGRQQPHSGGAAGLGGDATAGAAGSHSNGGTAGSISAGGSAGASAGGASAGGDGAGGASAGGDGAGGAGGVGATVRTCSEAGGNRCAAAASACAGLKQFQSSDCGACCLVPENPIITGNWADPFIARDGDTYVALATGSTVRRRTSKDLVHWSRATAALDSAGWKKPSFGFWAPTVYQAKNGKWILYYASERAGSSTQKCIGRAVSSDLYAKFVDDSSAPFLCRSSHWSIDPSVFTDNDGKDYLLWRQDTADQPAGNAFIQALDDAGRLKGSEHLLISRAKSEPSWEIDKSGGVLENPAMIRAGGYYHLFYSGFRWETANYANGHAICDTPIGPCTKRSLQTPWLGSQGGMQGPGGADFVTAADGTRFIYMHGWTPKVGDGGARSLWLYRFGASGETASIAPL